MKIFLPPLEIGDEEGFAPEKDLFDRKDFGEGLRRLITNVDDPLVIAIDGQWGSGKTTFLRMWAGELQKKEFPVVFFDAFAHDYMSDAFTALAGQIIALAEKKKKSEGPQTKEFVSKAKRVGKILLRSSLKIGIKAATLGALDGEDVEGVARDAIGDIAKEASDLEDKYIGELLTKQTEEKEAIEGFKAALQLLSGSLTDEMLADKIDSKPANKPLVFIIDELDRCRPDFALSLLERIKHFFSVQNVYFVLGVHSAQLENSVRAFYGDGIDAHNYLQKFIHFSFPIRSDENYTHIRDYSINYVRGIFRAHEFPATKVTSELIKLLTSLVLKEILSLRAVERIASNCALLIAFDDNSGNAQNGYLNSSFLEQTISVHLIIMKTINRDFYQQVFHGTLEYEKFRAMFKQTSPDLTDAEKYFGALWSYLLIGRDNDGFNFLDKIGEQDRRKIIEDCVKRIVERTGR